MGRQVGVNSINVDTLPGEVQITERILLDLPLHPTSPRTSYTSQYTLGPDLRLREFRVTLPGRSGPVIQQGRIEGDSVILITPGTGEPSWRLDARSFSLIPPLMAPVVMARQQSYRRGMRAEYPVFDPVSLSEGRISLAVVDDSTFLVPDSADFDSAAGLWVPAHSDTIPAWLMEWSDGRQATMMWVDSRGLPIRVSPIAGFALDRSAFEIVNMNYRRRRGASSGVREGGVVPRTAVAAGVEPERGVNGMRVRLRTERGFLSLGTDSLASMSQSTNRDDVIEIARRSVDTAAIPAADSSAAPWLADTPLLGLSDATLSRQASSILGGAASSWSRASRLVSWVSQNIRRTPDLTLPRAATVLREGQADVDGHTLLFVALARAAGLPARPVSGILLAGGKFYLHSWAEVDLGGWVAVDPTWGEFPAGANRVRIAEGLLARPPDLLPLVAGLDVELLTLTRAQ